MSANLHDRDFYAWTHQQAELIRQGRLTELDTEHLLEELDDMGASQYRELENRLGVLLAHLLKWRYQPERRGNSWRLTIKDQRRRIGRLLQRNPGLTPRLQQAFVTAYEDAVLLAAKETEKDESAFPPDPPFTCEQALGANYWPDDYSGDDEQEARS
jgi:hypothetical protein